MDPDTPVRSRTPDLMIEDLNGYTLWFGEKLPEAGGEEIGRRYRTFHDDLTDDGSGRPPRRQFDEPSERWGRSARRPLRSRDRDPPRHRSVI